ncbi:MAG: ATP-binding protein [Nanoarchaeota archaeon]
MKRLRRIWKGLDMDSEKLAFLLKEKENLTLEFKEKYSSRIDEDIVAFSNTKGGVILLGIDDTGKVVGQDLTNDLKAKINTLARNCKPSIEVSISCKDNIVIIEVLEGDQKPYSCSAGYFRRLDGNTQKMSTEELKILFHKSDKTSFEEKYNGEITFEDVSVKKVNKFLAEAKVVLQKEITIKDILSSLGAAKNDQINNTGVLFFAKEPRKFILQCQMTLIAFKGTDRVHIYDRRDIQDDLLTQFKEAVTFLEKHLNVKSEILDINRQDIYEIPFNALREGIVNSIIHRDYSIRGTSLMVEVYDDRVEITNPGGLPEGVTKEDLGKISIRRNELIADYFSRVHKAERVGSGIKRMKEAMIQANLPLPQFETSAENSFFTIVFKRPVEGSTKKAPESTQKTTQKTTQKILQAIQQNPTITRKELSELMNITEDGIKYHLDKMRKQGIIKRIGPDKGGHWEIVKK